jgi:DNA helicase-2/ATP-dependent DNA helicase PcrA
MASREEDLKQLSDFSTKFSTMADFLAELALLTNTDSEDVDGTEYREEQKVILSTIHQAKGLEWQVVIMIWCAEGMLPLERALREEDGEEEERRLFYVASTRAKDQLYFCYPLIDYNRGMGHQIISPSRFIREIAPSSLHDKNRPFDQWQVDEQW